MRGASGAVEKRAHTMFKLYRAIWRANLAAALLCSAAPVFAADVNPEPTPAPEELNFFTRLYHAYGDEWGLASAPVDPNAPPGPPTRRPAPWPPAPESTPPMPFADWPAGGLDYIGVSTPNAVDSPLMKAIGTDNPVGKTLNDAHIQIYGWANIGGDFSTAHKGYGGNAPAAYAFTPDITQLDQAVAYIERVPDTVQQEHVDWGFRVAPIWGENYRYTQSFAFPGDNALLYHNQYAGFDIPMAYLELYVPRIGDVPIFEGLEFRLGRYISVPDIEAQLAPNNYMYSHSMTYAVDNYTNQGLLTSLKVTKNWMLQFGVSIGTETRLYNTKYVSLINPNTGFQGYSGPKDPGAQPTYTGCVQYDSDTSHDNIYLCANGMNSGQWGFNNLQWLGGTYYHKFNDQWHISIESYYMYQNNVTDVLQGYGATPFAYIPFNAPYEAVCPFEKYGQTSCTAREWTVLFYLDYQFSPLDNLSLRGEFYNDINGQRTGYATAYNNWALGWQHWFSPQIEIRPELAYYHALDKPAFDNGTRHALGVASMDLIWHY